MTSCGTGGNKLGSAVLAPYTRHTSSQAPSGNTPIGDIASYSADGQGATNTINRAELLAILQAVQSTTGDVIIATDSACSLSQIHNSIMSPKRMAFHKHKHLLQAILQALASHVGDVTLCKVKAHIGVIGNEVADYHAKQAATEHPTHGCYTDHATAWLNLYWLWHTPATSASQPMALDDVGAAVKKHMAKLHTSGTANTFSYYFREWLKIAPETCACLSNTFMASSSTVTWLQRKHALQYRTGTLLTGRRAHLLSKATSDACVLCGRTDTNHHSVSECPALSNIVTERHNKAGRMVLQAVRMGKFGAYIVAADVGIVDDDVRPALPRSIPNRFLPPEIQTAPSRPDIVLCIPHAMQRRTLICVEIKYCCDYRPQHQQQHAAHQHARTMQALRQQGYEVQLVTLLLGVAGTIFHSTYDAMHTNLGLSKQATTDTCRKLHGHAIASLSSIYRTKLHLNETRPNNLQPP